MNYKFIGIKYDLIYCNILNTYPTNFIGYNRDIIYFLNENTRYHREDGPAVIWADGTQFWYKNDQYHREDGPAIIYANGTQEWYKNGKQHREDGPAAIYSNGMQEWYLNNKNFYNLKEYLEALNKIRPRTPEEIKHIKAQWK